MKITFARRGERPIFPTIRGVIRRTARGVKRSAKSNVRIMLPPSLLPFSTLHPSDTYAISNFNLHHSVQEDSFSFFFFFLRGSGTLVSTIRWIEYQIHSEGRKLWREIAGGGIAPICSEQFRDSPLPAIYYHYLHLPPPLSLVHYLLSPTFIEAKSYGSWEKKSRQLGCSSLKFKGRRKNNRLPF